MKKILLFVFVLMASYHLEAQEKSSLKFEASADNVVQLPVITDFINLQEFTLEFWVKKTAVSTWSNILYFGWHKLDNKGIVIQIPNTDNLTIAIGDKLAKPTNLFLPVDTWCHVAYVFNGSLSNASERMKLYVDGVEVTLPTNVSWPTQTPGTLHSNGCMFGKGNFGGNLSDVRFWKKAISEATITAWKDKFVDNSHPDYSSLTCNWKMTDSGTPTVVKDFVGEKDGEIVGNVSYGGITTGISDLENDGIICSPNPATNYLILNGQWLSGPNVKISLIDMAGKVHIEKTGEYQENTPIDISNVPQGIYLLSVETNTKHFTQKIVVTK